MSEQSGQQGMEESGFPALCVDDLEVEAKSLAPIHQAGSLAEAGAWAPS